MSIEQSMCPHCGSGDVERLISPPRPDDVFVDVPAAHRRCLVCGVRWELDSLNIDERSA